MVENDTDSAPDDVVNEVMEVVNGVPLEVAAEATDTRPEQPRVTGHAAVPAPFLDPTA